MISRYLELDKEHSPQDAHVNSRATAPVILTATRATEAVTREVVVLAYLVLCKLDATGAMTGTGGLLKVDRQTIPT